ncbi:hypothetical protein D3C77_367350 [compost metagenome]
MVDHIEAARRAEYTLRSPVGSVAAAVIDDSIVIALLLDRELGWIIRLQCIHRIEMRVQVFLRRIGANQTVQIYRNVRVGDPKFAVLLRCLRVIALHTEIQQLDDRFWMLAVLAHTVVSRNRHFTDRGSLLVIHGYKRNSFPLGIRIVVDILLDNGQRSRHGTVEQAYFAARHRFGDLRPILNTELPIQHALGVQILKLLERILHTGLNAAVHELPGFILDPFAGIHMIAGKESGRSEVGICQERFGERQAERVILAVAVWVVLRKCFRDRQRILHRLRLR